MPRDIYAHISAAWTRAMQVGQPTMSLVVRSAVGMALHDQLEEVRNAPLHTSVRSGVDRERRTVSLSVMLTENLAVAMRTRQAESGASLSALLREALQGLPLVALADVDSTESADSSPRRVPLNTRLEQTTADALAVASTALDRERSAITRHCLRCNLAARRAAENATV